MQQRVHELRLRIKLRVAHAKSVLGYELFLRSLRKIEHCHLDRISANALPLGGARLPDHFRPSNRAEEVTHRPPSSHDRGRAHYSQGAGLSFCGNSRSSANTAPDCSAPCLA